MSPETAAVVQELRDDPRLRAQLREILLGDDLDVAGALTRLAEAQRRTEQLARLLDSILAVVSGMNDRIGKLDGDALERRYRERGQAYLSRIARRLRVLDANTLNPIVDDGEQAGQLSEGEANAVLLADAVFAGLDRRDGARIHLVVEASVTIARHNVRRARECADLLARVVDTPVIAVVAGEFAPAPVKKAAQEAGVWQVTNGRAVAPEDDLDLD